VSGSKYFPRRLSFSKICDVLVAYLNAGAEKEYVGVSEVVNKSNVALHNISRNNNFFKSWGFIRESDKEPGKYMLTQEAAEFASAYRIDPNGEHTKEMLRKILSKDEVIAKFVERIKNEGLDRNTILVDLPRIIGDLRADKVGLNAFLDMLAYAFQITELCTPAKTTRQPEKARAKTTRRTAPTRILEATIPTITPRANISISLTISPEIPPEKLKEYIKAVLEAYEEYREKA